MVHRARAVRAVWCRSAADRRRAQPLHTHSPAGASVRRRLGRCGRCEVVDVRLPRYARVAEGPRCRRWDRGFHIHRLRHTAATRWLARRFRARVDGRRRVGDAGDARPLHRRQRIRAAATEARTLNLGELCSAQTMRCTGSSLIVDRCPSPSDAASSSPCIGWVRLACDLRCRCNPSPALPDGDELADLIAKAQAAETVSSHRARLRIYV